MSEVKPLGRPSGYRSEYCEQLEKHMSFGFSFESFAGEVGVCFKTLYNWEKQHEDFLQAKKRGTAKSLKFWEHMGISGAGGMIDGFNVVSWIFNMKNRFGWGNMSIEQKAEEKKLVINYKGVEVNDPKRDGEEVSRGESSKDLGGLPGDSEGNHGDTVDAVYREITSETKST